MERITQWNANALVPENKFHHVLQQKPDELKKIIPPNSSEIETVIEKRKNYVQSSIHREQLVKALTISHQQRKAPTTSLKTIESLSHPDTYLIITGQQPGLLGGPLYSFYKILHTIHYARWLSEQHPALFLPAFWNATEDDNRSEINFLNWLGQDKVVHHYHWQLEQSQPYFTLSKASLPLQNILEQIRESIQSTEFLEDTLNQIQTAYEKAISYPDFIDQLLWLLFPNEGLIIIHPDDFFIRQQSIPLIQHEIQNPAETSKAVNKAGELLHKHDLPIQLHKKENRCSFFLLDQNQRLAIYHDKEEFYDTAGKRYTKDMLLQRLEENPEHVSSTAILRPVIQDAILPTVSVILGPNELAYHFLLDRIYKNHEVPRPALMQRFGCTLFESRDRKHLERYDLSPMDMLEDHSALLKRITQSQNSDVRVKYFEQIEKNLDQFFTELKEEAQSVDPTIIKVLEKNENKIRQQLEQSENLLVRRKSDKNKTTSKHIQALQNALYPNGVLQERYYNVFFYWMKYGADFLRNIKEETKELKEGEHAFLSLP